MSISFAPSTTRELDDSEQADLRISIVEGAGGSRGFRRKSIAFDLRVHPEVCAKWGLVACDRVIGTVDDDGTWTLTKVARDQKGYSVRIGGDRTMRGAKCNGRRGFAYFRFTGSKAAARALFKDLKHIECDLVGVEGGAAMFMPKVRVKHMTFQPA